MQVFIHFLHFYIQKTYCHKQHFLIAKYTFIGLQKTGLIVSSKNTIVSLGDLRDPQVIVTLIGILVTLVLFIKNVPGNLLIIMIINTFLAVVFGIVDLENISWSFPSFYSYTSVFGAMSWSAIGTLTFWFSTFSLAMVVVFENIGLIHGH